jgi:hypothetical protein
MPPRSFSWTGALNDVYAPPPCDPFGRFIPVDDAPVAVADTLTKGIKDYAGRRKLNVHGLLHPKRCALPTMGAPFRTLPKQLPQFPTINALAVRAYYSLGNFRTVLIGSFRLALVTTYFGATHGWPVVERNRKIKLSAHRRSSEFAAPRRVVAYGPTHRHGLGLSAHAQCY